MSTTMPGRDREASPARPRRGLKALLVVLAVLVLGGVAAVVALGGLDSMVGRDGSRSGDGQESSEYAELESAVLSALRSAYGDEVSAVEVALDATGTVGVTVRTSLPPDTELLPRALQLAGEAASLDVLRRQWPDGTIVVRVWPQGADTYMTGAVAKVRDGALAGPVRVHTEESFRPGMSTP